MFFSCDNSTDALLELLRELHEVEENVMLLSSKVPTIIFSFSLISSVMQSSALFKMSAA